MQQVESVSIKMRLYLLAVLVSCACASPQYVKSRYSGVKGGNSGHGFPAGENLIKYNNTQSLYSSNNSTNILTEPVNYEKGVCYIEVPTASLARDPANIPSGNGSRPDLSRIRTCCKGYTKNIYNFKICDPVCTKECVNALCTGPDTCTCFPDHVKNLAGFCVPTCPIGCQNGQCAGGECICNNGFRLDSESRFCIPICKDDCGGVGNCTAPNICECRSGYRYSPEGSCQPHCDRCGQFAECVAPNDCRCRGGYSKNPHGDCVPRCANDCQPNGQCVAPNVCNYPTTTTTSNPMGHLPQERRNNPNMATTGSPNNYPYPQQPAYPGSQANYPGSQQQYYPGYQGYPYNQPGQSNQPNYQQPLYPGHQPINNTDQQNSNSGLRPIQPSNQPPNYPDQYPTNLSPPMYNNPGQQPPNYSGSQYGYYDQQRPNNPDNQQPNSYYPGNQQNYPGNQYYYPQYPQQQGNYPVSNQSYINPSYTSHQQSQNLRPDSQLGNVEMLCSKPCINGICVGQDRCVCNEGYVLDTTDPTVFRCTPYCPGGCPNGVCSSPYFCICNQGYRKDHSVKGRSNCVKRIRRSVEEPINIADLLIFEIPDYEEY